MVNELEQYYYKQFWDTWSQITNLGFVEYAHTFNSLISAINYEST